MVVSVISLTVHRLFYSCVALIASVFLPPPRLYNACVCLSVSSFTQNNTDWYFIKLYHRRSITVSTVGWT